MVKDRACSRESAGFHRGVRFIRAILYVSLCTLCPLASPHLLAEEDAAENDDEESVQITVPQALHQNRSQREFSSSNSSGPLTLRLDDQDYILNEKKVVVPFSPYPETFDLRDKKGRIVFHGKDYVGRGLLRGSFFRNHAVSFNFGESYSPSKRWKKILFDQTRYQQGLDYEYQPGTFGILISLIYQSNTGRAARSLATEYEGSQQRFALRRLWAPFTSGYAFYRKLHLGLYCGIFTASHNIEYRDGMSSLETKSKNHGVVAGYDVSYPFAENFWLLLRADATWQRIQFKELNFDQSEFQQGYGLGVKYAF